MGHKYEKIILIYTALLSLLAGARAPDDETNETEAIDCHQINFNDQVYGRELLFPGQGMAAHMAIHPSSETLFFSSSAPDTPNNIRSIVACHFVTKVCKTVHTGRSVFYYDKNDEIYIGGYDGIYKYNSATETAELLLQTFIELHCIYVAADIFYYTGAKSHKLFRFSDRVAAVVRGQLKIDYFYITKHNIAYFSTKSGLYKSRSIEFDTNDVVLHDDLKVRQIAEDKNGNVYICATDGIYMEQPPHETLVRVSDISSYGLVVVHVEPHPDKLIIIHSDTDNIYRLIPSDTSGCLNLTRSGKRAENAGMILSFQINIDV